LASAGSVVDMVGAEAVPQLMRYDVGQAYFVSNAPGAACWHPRIIGINNGVKASDASRRMADHELCGRHRAAEYATLGFVVFMGQCCN